jgi:hypothetical protein
MPLLSFFLLLFSIAETQKRKIHNLIYKLHNQTVGGGFNRRESTSTSKVYNNPKVVEIFQDSNWIVYFNSIKGYGDEIAIEFFLNFQNVREHD